MGLFASNFKGCFAGDTPYYLHDLVRLLAKVARIGQAEEYLNRRSSPNQVDTGQFQAAKSPRNALRGRASALGACLSRHISYYIAFFAVMSSQETRLLFPQIGEKGV